MGWIIFLALAIPLIGVVAWIALDESFVRIEPGELGLLLVKGKATDRALEPGPHWVPALRRRMVQTYPSLEMAYRAGVDEPASDLARSGPAVRTPLADRSSAGIAYTVRFRLDTASLRIVHERFGRDGIWDAVRDGSEAAIRSSLARAELEELFGDARVGLEQRLGDAVTEAMAGSGIVVTMFQLGDVDLGRTGEVIEATARAHHELAREQAEASLRLARARIDAELAPFAAAGGADLALRYREVDSWYELARARRGVLPVPARTGAAEAPAEPAATAETSETGEEGR